MKTVTSTRGSAFITMTVGELKAALGPIEDAVPVLITWEGQALEFTLARLNLDHSWADVAVLWVEADN